MRRSLGLVCQNLYSIEIRSLPLASVEYLPHQDRHVEEMIRHCKDRQEEGEAVVTFETQEHPTHSSKSYSPQALQHEEMAS